MKEYWDNVWNDPDINKYKSYAEEYIDYSPIFIDIFRQNKVKTVCDAACGFGAYSVMLSKNKFRVMGFDISKNALCLTKMILDTFHCDYSEYKVCGITCIDFCDECFDAAVAHAVIDHLSAADAIIAINELLRITKRNGLIYLSFDGLSEEDENIEYEALEDGSRIYSDGLLFKHYNDDDISNLLHGQTIVHGAINRKGDREIILRKN